MKITLLIDSKCEFLVLGCFTMLACCFRFAGFSMYLSLAVQHIKYWENNGISSGEIISYSSLTVP